jgi:hypothetical protein
MFGLDEFQQFVKLAGEGLRDEDARVARCLQPRADLYGATCPPGILWHADERHYQFAGRRGQYGACAHNSRRAYQYFRRLASDPGGSTLSTND